MTIDAIIAALQTGSNVWVVCANETAATKMMRDMCRDVPDCRVLDRRTVLVGTHQVKVASARSIAHPAALIGLRGALILAEDWSAVLTPGERQKWKETIEYLTERGTQK